MGAASPTMVVATRSARQAEEPPSRRAGLRCVASAGAAAQDASAPAKADDSGTALTAAAAAGAVEDPGWLLRFILTPFYDACPKHSPRHRSERNRYDVATDTKLCQYCATERARNGGGDGRPLIQLCRVRGGHVCAGKDAGPFLCCLFAIACGAMCFSSFERVY